MKWIILLIFNLAVSGEANMDFIQIASDSISLRDEDYYSDDERNVQKKVIDQISDAGISSFGIAISGLRKIDINEHASLPVLSFHRLDQRRVAEFNVQRNLIAVAVNAKGELFAASAYHYKKKVDFSRYPEPDLAEIDSEVDVVSTGCKKYDLRESLDIPWVPDNYRVTFIYFNWLSNTVTTELVGQEDSRGTAKQPLPEKIDYQVPLKAHVSKGGPEIRFSLPDKVNAVSNTSVLLTAEICLPAEGIFVSKTETTTTAWKPLTLLFIRKNQDQKPVLRYDFIVGGTTGELSSGDAFLLEGKIDIDLYTIAPSLFSYENHYKCYLVSFDKIAGPVAIEVVKDK